MTSRIRSFISLVIFALPVSAVGQGRERVIDWHAQQPLESIIKTDDRPFVPSNLMALEIVSILAAGKKVTLGWPFIADEDWMRSLRVRVKNVSGKPMARISFPFCMPEAIRSGALLGSSLKPEKNSDGSDEARELTVIMPNEEVELSLTEERYQHNRNWVAVWTGITSISKVSLDRAVVTFEDGVVWGGQPRVRRASAGLR